MAEAINPIMAEMRLAQLLGEDQLIAQAPATPAAASPLAPAPAAGMANYVGNPFDDILGKAIESLNMVTRTEVQTNQLIDQYIHGRAELQDVMIAQSKMSVMAQLAVTTVNTAVNTFKEITQMQI